MVSQIALCCVSRFDRLMAVDCVGTKAEQLPTIRRVDRTARRKQFILAEVLIETVGCGKMPILFAKRVSDVRFLLNQILITVPTLGSADT